MQHRVTRVEELKDKNGIHPFIYARLVCQETPRSRLAYMLVRANTHTLKLVVVFTGAISRLSAPPRRVCSLCLLGRTHKHHIVVCKVP